MHWLQLQLGIDVLGAATGIARIARLAVVREFRSPKETCNVYFFDIYS
jgi:hypothetical protein